MSADTGRRLVDLAAEVTADASQGGLPRTAWIKTGVIGLLLVLLNWWQYPILIRGWLGDPNWTHGFIIPLFSLFLLYIWREELLEAPRRVCLWGLPLLLLSLAALLVSKKLIGNNSDIFTPHAIPIIGRIICFYEI